MTEPTISLREMRKDLVRFVGHLRMVECRISGAKLFALVEAVEAAMRLNALKMHDTHPSLEALDLRAALARFTNEEDGRPL